MRRWKELFLLLALVSVFTRLNGSSPQPPRVVADGCVALGALRHDIEKGLSAQGRERSGEVGHQCYWFYQPGKAVLSWQMYFDHESRLTGAVGRPGRIFFSDRRLLLTDFARPSVIKALEDQFLRLDYEGNIFGFQGVVFTENGQVGLGKF